MARVSRRLWLGIGALLLTGCLSPTLPLPPPDLPVVTAPDADGNIELSGYVQPTAIAEAFDLRSTMIYGQESDSKTGHYDFKMPAQSGDQIEFFYDLGDDTSSSVVFTVPKP
jgi:hypothetical protein